MHLLESMKLRRAFRLETENVNNKLHAKQVASIEHTLYSGLAPAPGP